MVDHCTDYRFTSWPQPSQKVLLRFLNWTFRNVICDREMYLGEHCNLYIVNNKTHLSTGAICTETAPQNALFAPRTERLSPFVHSTQPYVTRSSIKLLLLILKGALASEFEAISLSRHEKNVLRSNHSTLRSMLFDYLNLTLQLKSV